MNERIKQLVLQAKIGTADFDAGSYYVATPDRMQEFAELIVRECAEQSMSIGRYNTPSGVTPDLSIAIAVGLKKHFGVTE